ncbi:MAG TPA: sulfotransferase [Rhodanobacteraceae bacterium]|nr:sulfotransferase [Rhodanobacteraceae bacterium]
MRSTGTGMAGTAASAFDAEVEAARAQWQADQAVRAEATLRTVIHRAPAHAGAATLLAEVLRSQGRLSAAAEVMLDVARANAFAPSLCLQCAYFAQQCDRHAVAVAICAGALARGGAPAELLVLAGHVARESGDFDAARAHYRAALEAGVDLERHHVLAALANTRRYTDAADPEIARFTREFANLAQAPRARASAGFALAKAQDDLGDYAAAADTLRTANALVHTLQPWRRAAWRAFVDARQRDRIALLPRSAAPDFRPVFIVGVPRTGTTLTATLLAHAAGARDRGELRTLRYVAERLIAGGRLADPAALAEAAELYRTLAVQDDHPAPCYLDQDPLNFRYLQLALAMFPSARVIHLLRDPRDTALSLWSQDFAHPDLAFAYDFADIADYMAGHAELMAHWRQRLGAWMFDLHYETLVAEPDATIAKLRAFIGAAGDASRTSPEGSAPVQSASVWQARQPVYSTSAGRWRHYAPYVPELAGLAPQG